jgi:hypothetical protein
MSLSLKTALRTEATVQMAEVRDTTQGMMMAIRQSAAYADRQTEAKGESCDGRQSGSSFLDVH